MTKPTWEKVKILATSLLRCRRCGFPLAGTVARRSPGGIHLCGRCYWQRTESTA